VLAWLHHETSNWSLFVTLKAGSFLLTIILQKLTPITFIIVAAASTTSHHTITCLVNPSCNLDSFLYTRIAFHSHKILKIVFHHSHVKRRREEKSLDLLN
jgi:hypothetical protein